MAAPFKLWEAVVHASRMRIDPHIEFCDMLRDSVVEQALPGGDPNQTPPGQHSCLFIALSNPEMSRIVHTLLAHDAKWALPVDANSGALQLIARAPASVQLHLFGKGAPLVHALDAMHRRVAPDSGTLLHAVVRSRDTAFHMERVRELLRSGAVDPSLPDAHGKRAYEYAPTPEIHNLLMQHVLGDARGSLEMHLQRRLGEHALRQQILRDFQYPKR